jgi:hypothetical protein
MTGHWILIAFGATSDSFTQIYAGTCLASHGAVK